MTHAEAAAIARVAWQRVHGRSPTFNELLFTLAVAWLESEYGRHAGQHARWAADGKITWGNVELPMVNGVCPSGTTLGSDDKNARCFRVWSTDLDAAVDEIRTLTIGSRSHPRSVVLAAMTIGTPEAVAGAMKQTGYFEAPASAYAVGLRDAARRIRPALGGVALDSPLVPLAIVAIVAGAVVWLSASSRRLARTSGMRTHRSS